MILLPWCNERRKKKEERRKKKEQKKKRTKEQKKKKLDSFPCFFNREDPIIIIINQPRAFPLLPPFPIIFIPASPE